MATKQVNVCDLCGMQEDWGIPQSESEIGKVMFEFEETKHPGDAVNLDICHKCAVTLTSVMAKLKKEAQK
jgi:hypothetical protein